MKYIYILISVFKFPMRSKPTCSRYDDFSKNKLTNV